MLCFRYVRNMAFTQIQRTKLYTWPKYNNNNTLLRNHNSITITQNYFGTEERWRKMSPFRRFTTRFFETSNYFVPIHVTSTGLWFVLFFSLCESEIDLLEILSSMDVEEIVMDYLQSSPFASLAVSLFLLKTTAPLRYVLSVFLAYILPVYRRRRRFRKQKRKLQRK